MVKNYHFWANCPKSGTVYLGERGGEKRVQNEKSSLLTHTYLALSDEGHSMYSKASLDEIDARELDGVPPQLKAVGYELQTEKMRPSVWLYDEGDSNNRHWQREQEELYYVMEGTITMEVDAEEIELGEGEFVVVSPDAWRQITALEPSTIFAVGAPNVADDAVTDEEPPS